MTGGADDSSKWRAEMLRTNQHLRMQLDALRAGPCSRWRKFRVLEVLCGRCGEHFVEIMETDPYRVIRFRKAAQHPNTAALPANAGVTDYIERMKARGPLVRRDEWSFYPIPNPLPADSFELDQTLIHCVCRCRQTNFSERWLFRHIREGTQKVIVPPPPPRGHPG